MVGETEEKWRDAVKRAIELEPDSVTIYQMELPYNTSISQDILKKGIVSPIAGWSTKRRWLDYAFEQFLAHDYEIAGTDIVATKKKTDRKSTRLNSSHSQISYAVFCLKKKK